MINLKEGAQPSIGAIYNLLEDELVAIGKYINHKMCNHNLFFLILNDKPIDLIIFGALKGANTTKGTTKGCSALDCNSISLKNYEDNTMIWTVKKKNSGINCITYKVSNIKI
jgi:hypothetical protein